LISCTVFPATLSISFSSLLYPLNATVNPTCHLLALLGVHHILHVSRGRVNVNMVQKKGGGGEREREREERERERERETNNTSRLQTSQCTTLLLTEWNNDV